MADDAVDRQLEEMAGSRRAAQDLRRNLEKLRGGVGGPILAEMARDVLDGRITLRDVTRSSAYAGPLTDAMRQFREAHDRLSEEERAELVRQAEESLRDESD